MTDTNAASPPCHVCGRPLTQDIATCNNCERPFHLRQREDSDSPDCGEVWISEQHLALEYACNVCLKKSPDRSKPLPPSHLRH
jgi:hypothetical protein